MLMRTWRIMMKISQTEIKTNKGVLNMVQDVRVKTNYIKTMGISLLAQSTHYKYYG